MLLRHFSQPFIGFLRNPDLICPVPPIQAICVGKIIIRLSLQFLRRFVERNSSAMTPKLSSAAASSFL